MQEVLRSLRRNNWMTFAAVGTVAVSLFILGVFLILALNMNRAASMLESQVQISVYLKDDLSKGAPLRASGRAEVSARCAWRQEPAAERL